MISIEILGFIAAALTTLSFAPQAWLVIRTRRTEGISLAMYSIFTSGVLCWVIYGLQIKNLPLIVANTITLMFAAVILAILISNRIRPSH